MPLETPPIQLDPYLAGIEALLQALQLAGLLPDLDPIDAIIGAFSGRPTELDTEITAALLQTSQWWPVKALGANLEIWVRNQVPLSTGVPAYREQLSDWIRGTITSLEPIVYQRADPLKLDTLIWRSMTSQWGTEGILQLDNYIASQHGLGPLPTPPPTTPPPMPGANPDPCQGLDPNSDEALDSCRATQAALQQIIGLLEGQQQGQGVDQCCLNVIWAINRVATQLILIATTLSGLEGPAPLDVSGIVTELTNLVAAVQAYPPALTACCEAITGQLNALVAAVQTIASSGGVDVSQIVKALQAIFQTLDVPKAAYEQWAKDGAISPTDLQLIVSGEFGTGVATFFKNISHFLAGPINPKLGEEVAQNLRDYAAGKTPTYQPIHSLLDAFIALFMNVGFHWSQWGQKTSSLVSPAVQTAFDDLGAALKAGDPRVGTDVPLTVGWPATAAIKFVMSAPPRGEAVTLDNYATIAQDAFGRAGMMGFIAFGVAMVSGWLFGAFAKGMEEIAALIATAAGFKEISERWLGPFLDAIIRNRAIQDANHNWPTRVPPGPQALALFARRKIAQADANTLQGYAGLDPAWRPAMYAGAYRPVTPFVLASAFVDQPIDHATILDILQDNAYSDSHAATMADAIVYKSIANIRNSYLSSLISGYQKGVVGDDELQEVLTEFNFSPLAQQYVKSHVLILRREVLAAKVQSEVVSMVAVGTMAPDQGLQQLEAAGIQPWLAELEITLAETKATVAAAKKELALEAKEALQAQRNLTRAAVAEFQRGVLDAAGLTAALAALNVPASLIASIVAVQTATRAGRMKYVYGQLLNPADAKVLNEKIAAIRQQAKDQLITLDQELAQLTGLGVDQADAQAMVSKDGATLKKSPGAAVLVQP